MGVWIGSCDDGIGVTNVDITVQVPKAVEVPPSVPPPFVDYPKTLVRVASDSVFIVPGIWRVRFIRSGYTWDGTAHDYHIFNQAFLAMFEEPDITANAYAAAAWPANNVSDTLFTEDLTGIFINTDSPYFIGTPAIGGNGRTASDQLFDFGCANCNGNKELVLSVTAGAEIYGGNARAFQVRMIGERIG
jgi:hypothetical protein